MRMFFLKKKQEKRGGNEVAAAAALEGCTLEELGTGAECEAGIPSTASPCSVSQQIKGDAKTLLVGDNARSTD